MEITELLRKLDENRAASGLSRAEWLRRANITESMWYRWQNGENLPNFRSIQKLLAKKTFAKKGAL